MYLINACAYCRVSTSSKDQENSYENQKRYFEREVEKNKEYKLVNIYADKGVSGTSLNRRDEFTKMLIDAGLDPIVINKSRTLFLANKEREPLFKKIYVKNTSRFARNVMVIEILRELLKKEVHVQFLDINLLFDSSEKEFILNLFLNFDQQDSIDKSIKVRFGKKEGAKNKKINTTGTLYGYSCDFENNKLHVIEEEAKVIRLIYDLYTNDYGFRRIIKYLDDNKIYTRYGKSFVPSMIKRILSNEKYCGDLVRNKYDCGTVLQKNSYAKIKPESEWIIHPNMIPAIISKEIFLEAKKMRSGKKNHITQKGIYKGLSEFAQKIYCGECGSAYTRNIDRGKVLFNCSLKKSKGVEFCSGINVYEKLIEETLEGIQSNGIYEVFTLRKSQHLEQFLLLKEKLLNKLDKPKLMEISVKKDELLEAEQEEERLLSLFLKGKINEDKYDTLKNEIETRVEVLKEELEVLSMSNDTIYQKINEVEMTMNKLKLLDIERSYTREETLNEIKQFIIRRNPEQPKKPIVSVELKTYDLIDRLTKELDV